MVELLGKGFYPTQGWSLIVCRAANGLKILGINAQTDKSRRQSNNSPAESQAAFLPPKVSSAGVSTGRQPQSIASEDPQHMRRNNMRWRAAQESREAAASVLQSSGENGARFPRPTQSRPQEAQSYKARGAVPRSAWRQR